MTKDLWIPSAASSETSLMSISLTHALQGDSRKKGHRNTLCRATLRQSSCGKQSSTCSSSSSCNWKSCQVWNAFARSFLEYVHFSYRSGYKVFLMKWQHWHLQSQAQPSTARRPRYILCCMIQGKLNLAQFSVLSVKSALVLGLVTVMIVAWDDSLIRLPPSQMFVGSDVVVIRIVM